MASNLGKQMDRQIVAGVDSSTQATKVFEPRHDASAALVRFARWHDIVRQAAVQPN
jgi:hypothetical protein